MKWVTERLNDWKVKLKFWHLDVATGLPEESKSEKKWVAYNHALSDIYSAGCEGLICSDNKGNYDKLKSNH